MSDGKQTTYTKRLGDGRYEYGDVVGDNTVARGIAASYREARKLQGYTDFWESHSCHRCKDGERACVQGGHDNYCSWPHTVIFDLSTAKVTKNDPVTPSVSDS